jgi:hypothetical protein
MNMVKEGIQTRRRKQKNSAGNSIPKSKHNKTSVKSSASESNHHHTSMTKDEEFLPRQGNYQYSELYPPPHVHLVHHHHPYEQHQRFSSLEMAANGFDAELCARGIVTSPINHNEEQHLNVIKSVNSNQP